MSVADDDSDSCFISIRILICPSLMSIFTHFTVSVTARILIVPRIAHDSANTAFGLKRIVTIFASIFSENSNTRTEPTSVCRIVVYLFIVG